MKHNKLLTSWIAAAALILTSCAQPSSAPVSVPYDIDYETAKSSYVQNAITITKVNINEADNVFYTKTADTITFNSATPINLEEPVQVELKGYFKGQIINNIEGLEIILKDVYLENEDAPAILNNTATENTKIVISAYKDTVNYVVSTGSDADTNKGAISSKAKDVQIEFGGSGTCYIVGTRDHGIKSHKVEFKGASKYHIQGSATGSDINCSSFKVDTTKALTLHLHKAKNGIKADKKINITGGTFNFYGTDTALKTDPAKTGDPATTINLTSCTVNSYNVTTLQSTDSFNKAEDVVIK